MSLKVKYLIINKSYEEVEIEGKCWDDCDDQAYALVDPHADDYEVEAVEWDGEEE